MVFFLCSTLYSVTVLTDRRDYQEKLEEVKKQIQSLGSAVTDEQLVVPNVVTE